MAYINFQKEFWSDDYILKLNRDQKLVYVYILTNEKTRQCGIYELPIIKASTELQMSAEEFILHLKKFNDDKKICYSMDTQEIAVINWRKYNENTSWKSYEKVKKELADVKNLNLLVLLYDPRTPLYDGFKNVKGIPEPYIIENPWKEEFKTLTDKMISDVRFPYKKNTNLVSFLCPIDAPYMPHHTNTVHNITNTYTEQIQNTETVEYEQIIKIEPKTVYNNIPSTKPRYSLSNKMDEAIKHWNSLNNLPPCAYTSLNIGNDSDMITKFDVYRDGQILAAIDNLSKYYDLENPKFRPLSFKNFITNSLDRWLDSVNPGSRYEDQERSYRTQEEKRYYILLERANRNPGDVPQSDLDRYKKLMDDSFLPPVEEEIDERF